MMPAIIKLLTPAAVKRICLGCFNMVFDILRKGAVLLRMNRAELATKHAPISEFVNRSTSNMVKG